MFWVGINVFDDEGREELVEELARDLLHDFAVDTLLEEAALEDVTPPTLHVGGHTCAKALLVSCLLKLSMEDIHDIVVVGRDEIYF